MEVDTNETEQPEILLQIGTVGSHCMLLVFCSWITGQKF